MSWDVETGGDTRMEHRPKRSPPTAGRPVPVEGGRRVRTYEELDGASGRALFFRPHRFSAADLAPFEATAEISAEGTHRCALKNVSQNGVLVTWPAGVPARLGQTLDLAVLLDLQRLWSGTARVTSVREGNGGKLVGAAFEGTLLDIDELLRLRDVWLPRVSSLGLADRPWHAPRSREAQALLAELRLYLEDTEERLRELEGTLPWGGAQERASPARAALVLRARDEITQELLRMSTAVDHAIRAADPAEADQLRELSVRQIQPFFMKAPWMHRARHKPLGYPGDYEVMNFFYERDFEGLTLFARILGYAFIQAPVVQAVCRRKDLMKRLMRGILAGRTASSRPVRILSIAAGPARELVELLAELPELPAPLEIVLFDQDKGALGYAYQRVRPLADQRFPGRIQIVFLNESITRLLRDRRFFADLERFDFVYSCGLFDYLHEATAVRLAQNLCTAARPGAPVLIGNMADHTHRWAMENLLEWVLLYRTRDQLRAIGERAAPGGQVRIEEEETGVNPFIEVIRN